MMGESVSVPALPQVNINTASFGDPLYGNSIQEAYTNDSIVQEELYMSSRPSQRRQPMKSVSR